MNKGDFPFSCYIIYVIGKIIFMKNFNIFQDVPYISRNVNGKHLLECADLVNLGEQVWYKNSLWRSVEFTKEKIIWNIKTHHLYIIYPCT